MKKERLMEYGIPEEKINEFQAEYWADVNKRVLRSTGGQEIKPTKTELRAAIVGIINVINCPDKLKKVLAVANYQYMKTYRAEDTVMHDISNRAARKETSNVTERTEGIRTLENTDKIT